MLSHACKVYVGKQSEICESVLLYDNNERQAELMATVSEKGRVWRRRWRWLRSTSGRMRSRSDVIRKCSAHDDANEHLIAVTLLAHEPDWTANDAWVCHLCDHTTLQARHGKRD